MLSEIPRLRVFIFSTPSHRDWGVLSPPESYEEYIPQIFANCKILQHIDISTGTEARTYKRWFRDGSPPRDIVEVDEVLLSCLNIS